MNKIKLFEIPIYSMREEIYEKRCMNFIEKTAMETSATNYESFYAHLKETRLLKRPWLYNQIVGYIVISYYQESIWFDEYATLDRKIQAIGNKKHFITNMMLNGHHFYVSKDMTENSIRENIRYWIESIKKNVLNKIWYLDTEIFENQLKYIDIKKMIYSENENR